MTSSPNTTSVVLVGVGGQGILLASQIIARAAVASGFDVKTNEVHGMAQRGGSVIAQVRYGQKVYSPLVPDGAARVLASLEQIEALRFASYLAPDGLAVVSDQVIIPVTVSMGQSAYPSDARARLQEKFPRLLYINAVEKATALGNVRAANVVLLGALSTGIDLPAESWLDAVAESVPPKARDLNIRAFQEGRSSV